MTCALYKAAARMPSAIVSALPASELFTLTDTIFASGATPTNGLPDA